MARYGQIKHIGRPHRLRTSTINFGTMWGRQSLTHGRTHPQFTRTRRRSHTAQTFLSRVGHCPSGVGLVVRRGELPVSWCPGSWEPTKCCEEPVHEANGIFTGARTEANYWLASSSIRQRNGSPTRSIFREAGAGESYWEGFGILPNFGRLAVYQKRPGCRDDNT